MAAALRSYINPLEEPHPPTMMSSLSIKYPNPNPRSQKQLRKLFPFAALLPAKFGACSYIHNALSHRPQRGPSRADPEHASPYPIPKAIDNVKRSGEPATRAVD